MSSGMTSDSTTGGTGVAVLVPVYDSPSAPAAAFLPRALESLRAQTAGGWEAVVVDDGSPGAAAVADVVAAAASPRIRLVRHEGNRGLGAALNAGLDATTAPVVAYLPADDVWTPGHLEALLGCLSDPGSGAGAVAAVRAVGHRLRPARAGRAPAHRATGGPSAGTWRPTTSTG